MNTSPESIWRCRVCGYIHRGPTPPDPCPVCGAPATEFELVPATSGSPAPTAFDTWRCLVCNHLASGKEPPAVCPVCGAGPDRFTAAGPDAPVAMGGFAGTALIVGAGIAGLAAAEALRTTAPTARLVLVGRERELPYYRLNLTRLLAGEIVRDDLEIHARSWYDERGIELRLGLTATTLDLTAKRLTCLDGEELAWDRLILTAGAHPFVPPVPGIQRHGVHPLRTLDEAERILALARPGMRCVVVGGGILGMEMAAALAGRGLAVSLLEGSAHLMPRQLDARAGTLLAARAAELGVAVVTTSRTETLLGDEQVAGVRLVDGRTLPADLVLIATGVRANSHLARRVGLEVGEGVVVDDRLHASAPDVWAAGDVCEHRGVMYGNWAAAQAQGTIAGINAGGGRAEFGGIPRSNTVKVLGVDLVSIGAVHAGDASWTELTVEADGTYRRYLLRDGRLVGALFFGNATLAPAATAAITAGADCSGLTTATALEDRLRG